MTLDDTEAVKLQFGTVTPVDPEDVQAAIDGHSRLAEEFEPGDSLYRYDITWFLAGHSGYLRVQGRVIVGAYFVGMF